MSRYEQICSKLRREPRRFLITGVAGFIGSNLLERLLELGQHVVGVDNFSTGRESNLADVFASLERQDAGGVSEARSRFELIRGDLRDPHVCRAVVRDVDVVLHQAALGSVPRSVEDPASSHASNVDSFVNLLIACRDARVDRIVYASSSSVYGDDASPTKIEDRLGRPLSPYAATKLCNETYADVFSRTYGLQCIGLRYFNVFGPRQDPHGAYAAVIPAWTLRCLAGEACVLYGDAEKSRDFCFVENVVAGNLLAALSSDEAVALRVFNIACGARTTLSELFELIRTRVEALHPRARPLALEQQPARLGDIEHSLADIERARRLLGYEPGYDIRRGLDVTVRWFDDARERDCGAALSLTA